MDPFILISALAGAVATLIGTGISYFATIETNKENRDYATQMTNAQWERDDRNLQIQVEDAKAAGLSPLAVTGSMNTSSPLNYVGQAPQMDLSSLLALSTTMMNNATTKSEGEANRKKSSEDLDKQLTYNLTVFEKQLKADKDLQNDQLAHDVLILGKQLKYQYDVLNEQSLSHSQDLESDRLIQLSNQSMETYSQISATIGMAPRTEYVTDLNTYVQMYNSFMVKYKNFLEDWQNVDTGLTTQATTSEGMSATALKNGVSFQDSAGQSYDSKSALLHDMYYKYFSDAVLPILVDDKSWQSRSYSYQE